MTEEMFSATGGANAADLAGHLLIVTGVAYREKVVTQYGEKDAVEVSVIDLDGNEYGNVVFFQGNLIGAFKSIIGKKPALGHISQGQAKAGQSAPWLFTDTTDAGDRQRAVAFMQARAAGTFADTATPVAAPAAAAATPVAVPAPAAPAAVDPNSPEIQALLRSLQQQAAS